MIGVNSKGESTLINRSEIILVPLGLIGIEYLPLLIELEYFSDEERRKQYIEATNIDYLKTPSLISRTKYANEILRSLWHFNWFLSRKYDIFGMINKGFALAGNLDDKLLDSFIPNEYRIEHKAQELYAQIGCAAEHDHDVTHNYREERDSQLSIVQAALKAQMPEALYNRIYNLTNEKGIVHIDLIADGLTIEDDLILCRCAAKFMEFACGYSSAVWINNVCYESKHFNAPELAEPVCN